MACYDCEDCPRSVDYGGKCNRFESDCPFVIVENYNSDELNSIKMAIKEISVAVKKLKELDTKEYLENEVNGILFYISNLEDFVSEDTKKEWEKIRKIGILIGGNTMKRITSTELRELKFGSKIRVIWHNSKYHEKNEEYYGVVFGDKIGYEDGKVDELHSIAECVFNDWCMVYLLTE